uniref:Uncharacterized protein n=1 Tax=Amphimedon queenslandica TaxID=400682 RepID=A0A1X7SLQ9_AMPQE
FLILSAWHCYIIYFFFLFSFFSVSPFLLSPFCIHSALSLRSITLTVNI